MSRISPLLDSLLKTTKDQVLENHVAQVAQWPSVESIELLGKKVIIKTKGLQVWLNWKSEFEIELDFSTPFRQWHFWGSPWLMIRGSKSEPYSHFGDECYVLFNGALYVPAGRSLGSNYGETFGDTAVERFGVCNYGGYDAGVLAAYNVKDVSYLYNQLLRMITAYSVYPIGHPDYWTGK